MTIYRPLVLISGVFAQLPRAGEIVVSGDSISAGGGSVNYVDGASGIGGGPITGSGTLYLENTAVTAGTYSLANITVDAQGRVTSAADGVPPSGSSGTVTQIATASGIGGGPITSAGLVYLEGTPVTAGDYKVTNISVDAQGRITLAADGSLDDLSDVAAGGASNGDLLQYDGSDWVNVAAGTVGGVTSVNGMTGDVLSVNGISVPTLSGVQITAVQDEQVLAWDAAISNWVNVDNIVGSGDINVEVDPNTGLTITGDNANANQLLTTTRTIGGVAASANVSGVVMLRDDVDTSDSNIAASLAAVSGAYEHVVYYAPDFTGSGATGEWGISVTGGSQSTFIASGAIFASGAALADAALVASGVTTTESTANGLYFITLAENLEGAEPARTNASLRANPGDQSITSFGPLGVSGLFTATNYNLSYLPALPTP